MVEFALHIPSFVAGAVTMMAAGAAIVGFLGW